MLNNYLNVAGGVSVRHLLPSFRPVLHTKKQHYRRHPRNTSDTCGSQLATVQCGCHRCPRSLNLQNVFLLGFLVFLIGSIDLVAALRNVNLIIEPPAVRRGQHAIVRCLYDLEGSPLYAAKFYRGQLEFYRYTPGEFPNTKVFPFPGIHVDVTSSNATQVLIRNVGFGLSGNFSCEITADRPLFSTATAIGAMQVVELPDKRPQLFTEHTRYEPGDVLIANCSTPPSRPRAELRFTINNMLVEGTETQYIRTIDNLIASRINLKLQLQAIHFANSNPLLLDGLYGGYGSSMQINSVHHTSSHNVGGLLLRCTAQIGELYQEYKEIELGTPQKDPVPARVTLSSGSSVRNFFSSYFSSSATAHFRLTERQSLLNSYNCLLVACLLGVHSILSTLTVVLHLGLATSIEFLAAFLAAVCQHLQHLRYKFTNRLHSTVVLTKQRLLSQR